MSVVIDTPRQRVQDITTGHSMKETSHARGHMQGTGMIMTGQGGESPRNAKDPHRGNTINVTVVNLVLPDNFNR